MMKSDFNELKKTMKAAIKKTYDEIYELTQSIRDGSMDISDASDRIDTAVMNKKEKILTEHQKHYRIWYAENDKRWKTKVPDFKGGKGEKLLARTPKENLENLIIEYYEAYLAPVKSLRTIFPEWIESKKNETSFANASKLQNVWERYYEKSKIVEISLKDLTIGSIKDFLYGVLTQKNLTHKQYQEFKSVINMMFDYSVLHEYVDINKAKQVPSPSINKYRVEVSKPIDEIIYSKAAQKSTIEKAEEAFKKNLNTSYLAICLNFQLGLRVGELSALKSTDINGDTITIEREEICERVEGTDNKLHKKGTKVVPHTKTLCGNRILPLTPEAKHYIKRVLAYNEANGLINPDGYLFLDAKGNRKTASSINSALRHINGTRNKKDGYDINGCPSGNHSIRKTVISNLHNSMIVPDVIIRDFAGHKDIATTQRHYIHPTNPMTDYKDVFANIFKAE